MNRLISWVLWSLALGVVGPALPVQARPAPDFQVAPGAAGLDVSLLLAKRVYARDELTRVVIVATNKAPAPVRLLAVCPYGDLRVEVRTGTGRVVYPPVVAGEPQVHCGGAPSVVTIGQGRTLRRRVFVIMRGRILQPVVTVVRMNGSSVAVEGRQSVVHLRPGTAPGVSIHGGPSGLSAAITPALGDRGVLRYRYWTSCTSGSSERGSSSSGTGYAWSATNGMQVRLDPAAASCPSSDHLEWHGVAGWVGQPVASFQDVRPADQWHELRSIERGDNTADRAA